MKIQQLFDKLEIATKDKEAVFADSGIVNLYDQMQYGFFPLGLGILTKNNKTKEAIPTTEIEDGAVMVLGNDFGTVSYVKNECNELGETDGKTVINLIERAGLDINRTFFTNFYLGVRLVDGLYKGTTMIKRIFDGKSNKVKDEYKLLCYNFFITQMEFAKPSVVICLGHDVKNALIENYHIADWRKTESLKKIYTKQKHCITIENFGNTKFIIIPHPCDLRNFKQEHINKLSEALNKESK